MPSKMLFKANPKPTPKRSATATGLLFITTAFKVFLLCKTKSTHHPTNKMPRNWARSFAILIFFTFLHLKNLTF